MVPSPLMSESKARKALLSQRSSSRAVLPCLLLSALITEQLVFHPQSLAGLKLVEANTDFQLKKIQRAQSRQRTEKAAAGVALLGGTGLLWDHMLCIIPIIHYYNFHFLHISHWLFPGSILCLPWQKLWKSWKLSYGVFLIFPDNWVCNVFKKDSEKKEQVLYQKGAYDHSDIKNVILLFFHWNFSEMD